MKNKKIIIWLIILLLVVGLLLILLLFKKEEDSYKTNLLDMEPYNKIVLEDIKTITVNRYTEGGSESTLYDQTNDITGTYNMLKSIRVGKETEMACEDNTTVYTITLNNDEEISVEIECDWIINQNKRYLIKK